MSMLYLLSIANMIFPLFTFPYLTRVLSMDGYALLVYVRAFMGYLGLWIGFGFLLSATKRVANAGNNPVAISRIYSDTTLAQLMLALSGTLIVLGGTLFIPLLRANLLFVWLSFAPVAISGFMGEYVFRGLERMQDLTYRCVSIRAIGTILLFAVVRSDGDLLWVPVIDIVCMILSVMVVLHQLRKYQVRLRWPNVRRAWNYIRESFHYFVGKVANTAYGAFTTLIIGIFLPEPEIAVWGVAVQLNLVIQSFYHPIIDSVYPEMTRSKKFSFLKKLLKFVMPIILVGCVIAYFVAPFVIPLLAGDKYQGAVFIFRLLIPVLLLAVPVMLIGWPALGAVGKVKHTAGTTWLAAATQCLGLSVLAAFGIFTLPLVAVVRDLTETVLFLSRFRLLRKYRREFKD